MTDQATPAKVRLTDGLGVTRFAPSVVIDGRTAASSPGVPSHDGLCGNGNYNERTEK